MSDTDSCEGPAVTLFHAVLLVDTPPSWLTHPPPKDRRTAVLPQAVETGQLSCQGKYIAVLVNKKNPTPVCFSLTFQPHYSLFVADRNPKQPLTKLATVAVTTGCINVSTES